MAPSRTNSRTQSGSNNNDNNGDGSDAATELLARELQEEHRQDFLSRQARKTQAVRATAPSASELQDVDVSIQPHSSFQQQQQQPNTEEDASSDTDSVVARRLQQQLEDEELARRLAASEGGTLDGSAPTSAHHHQQQHQPQVFRPPTEQELKDAELARRLANGDIIAQLNSLDDRVTNSTVSSNLSDDRRLAQELQDEEVARRYAIQQQSRRNQREGAVVLTDPELARRYTDYEQEQASRAEAHRMLLEDAKRRRRRCCVFWLVTSIVVGSVVGALFFFDVLNNETFNDIPDFSDWGNDDIIDIDPFAPSDDTIPSFNASDPGDQSEYYRWPNNGDGLAIQLVSALDEEWQGFFEIAVRDWDDGSPNALTLTTTRIPYEYDCDGVDGVIKVCNGNYGPTRWRGLNQVLLDRRRNLILQSSAKMNEYYLASSNDGQRQYTMCHEIGHGFGLPHWDEDFYNRDLGNCMDYTNNPEDNKRPDTSNFEFLSGLYGEVPIDDASNRQLVGIPDRPMADEVRTRHRRALKDVSEGSFSRWRRLAGDEHAETYQTDLGDDIIIQVHMLLA